MPSPGPSPHQDVFTRLSTLVSKWTGSPQVCFAAVLVILLWGLTGPLFHFSDTWQLVINTSTTIVTFLMVFLIQNTQNRESEALHLKIDELIRSNDKAHNRFMKLEDLSQHELDTIKRQFEAMAEEDEMNHL